MVFAESLAFTLLLVADAFSDFDRLEINLSAFLSSLSALTQLFSEKLRRRHLK